MWFFKLSPVELLMISKILIAVRSLQCLNSDDPNGEYSSNKLKGHQNFVGVPKRNLTDAISIITSGTTKQRLEMTATIPSGLNIVSDILN